MGITGIAAVGRVGVSPQRWARGAAFARVLCVLPSILWRVAMLAGVETGFADADWYRAEGARIAYVLGLDALQLAGALLCLALARPWGERVPRFVPGLGGRAIHRLVSMALGGAGAAALYLIMGQLLVGYGSVWLGLRDGWTPAAGMDEAEAIILGLAYAPLFCWPLVLTWRSSATGGDAAPFALHQVVKRCGKDRPGSAPVDHLMTTELRRRCWPRAPSAARRPRRGRSRGSASSARPGWTGPAGS